MKWDKRNKTRLYAVLRGKMEREGWVSNHGGQPHGESIIEFLHSHGIKKAQKIKTRAKAKWSVKKSMFLTSRRSFWTWCDPATKEPVADKDHVIILDPSYSREPINNSWSPSSGEGLSIPKDVAEKFLVLGIP